MRSLSILVVALGLQASQAALGASLFKCEYNGRVEFSDRPCQPVKAQNVWAERENRRPQPAPSSVPGPDAGRPANLAPAADPRPDGATSRKILASSDAR